MQMSQKFQVLSIASITGSPYSNFLITPASSSLNSGRAFTVAEQTLTSTLFAGGYHQINSEYYLSLLQFSSQNGTFVSFYGYNQGSSVTNIMAFQRMLSIKKSTTDTLLYACAADSNSKLLFLRFTNTSSGTVTSFTLNEYEQSS